MNPTEWQKKKNKNDSWKHQDCISIHFQENLQSSYLDIIFTSRILAA